MARLCHAPLDTPENPVLLLRIQGKIRAAMTANLGGVDVHFEQCVLRDGTPAMCAEIADEGPETDKVLQQASLIPSRYVVGDLEQIGWSEKLGHRATRGTVGPDAPVAGVVKTAVSTADGEGADDLSNLPQPLQQAARLGWTSEDVAECANFAFTGEETGEITQNLEVVSSITGLTLPQMALTEPPKGWAEKRYQEYPWEFQDFRPPGMDWKAPTMPVKLDPDAPPSEVLVDGGEAEGEDDTVIVDPDDLGDPDEAVVTPIEPKAIKGLSDEQLSTLEGYGTDDELSKAVEVIKEQTIEQKKVPHRNSINYHLGKKHQLPTVTDDEYEAIQAYIAQDG